MSTLSVRRRVRLHSDDLWERNRPGPWFHRWLPDGERDVLELPAGGGGPT